MRGLQNHIGGPTRGTVPFLLCGLLGLPRVVPGGEGLDLHVDPAAGVDAPGRGSKLEPLRTLSFALWLAGERGPRATVRLAPGEYAAPGEAFPVRVPASLVRAEILAEPGAELAGDGGEPLLVLSGSPSAESVEVLVSGLRFRGGLAGACLDLEPGVSVDAVFERCVFEDPAGKGLEVFVALAANADVRVHRSTFRGGFGGIAFEPADSTHSLLHVEECAFESIGAYGPGDVLGGGIEIHVDRSTVATARILRNRFLGGGAALQLTTAERQPDAPLESGSLDLVFAGNLVRGVQPGAPGASAPVRNAIYASLHRHHDLDLAVVSNTFSGIAGRVLFHDNLDELSSGGSPPPWVLANNIAWGIGADLEVDAENLPGFPWDWEVRSNILEKSLLAREGIDGNLNADPLFAGPGEERLAEGSPARDRGDAAFSMFTDIDLDGLCRRADAECPPPGGVHRIDIGAFEHPGHCDRESATFVRGDCNRSGLPLAISDPIFTFQVLFLGTAEAPCPDACDSNDDGSVDITDGVHVLNFLFLGGRPPAPPFELEGRDETPDCLAPCNDTP
jgi:hypothetical protein